MLPPLRRFETDRRYYVVRCSFDLWGELVVSRYWGGKHSRRGQQRHEPVLDTAAAEQRCAAIAQRRRQHGYCEMSG